MTEIVINISSTDTHTFDVDEGKISVVFEVITPDEYAEITAGLNGFKAECEFLRRVLREVNGVAILKDGVSVDAKEAMINSPQHMVRLMAEYFLFWQKKMLTKTLKTPPDSGQA